MLYEDLAKEGIRKDSERALPKSSLLATFKRSGLSKGALAKKANCAPSTIRVALEGNTVTKETADKIASALDRRFSELFKLQNDSSPLANKTILEHHRVISMIGGSLYSAEEEMNGLERDLIMNLTAIPSVRWWHRNIARHEFRINGFINHYPDVMIMTEKGHIIFAETKGEHLKNPDTQQKLKLGLSLIHISEPTRPY